MDKARKIAATAAIAGACFGAGCNNGYEDSRAEQQSGSQTTYRSSQQDSPPATPAPKIDREKSAASTKTGEKESSARDSWSDSFISYMKSVENSVKDGWDRKDNVWRPHKSPEGGLATIAYGHKATSQKEVERLSSGITEQEAVKLLLKDLDIARSRADAYLREKHGVSLASLPSESQEMLVDYAFNLGSLRGFPKFTKAVVEQDWATAKNEYKRTYKDESGKRRSLSRNKVFFDRYLSDK